MGLAGELTKADFGYSMPVDSPLYEPFPIYYRDITLMMFAYITDPKAAAALLPAQLELPEVAIAQMVFAKYPFSTVGAYNEVAQTIACTYHGKPAAYAVRLHVTNAMAMAAGREIGGFPKKLGEIDISTDGAMFSAHLQSPPGTELTSALAAPMNPIAGVIPKTLDFISMRVFPNPTDEANPSVAQLIGTQWVLENGEIWESRGNVHYTGASVIDPYHKLPCVAPIPPEVTKQTGILPCSLYQGGMSIKQVSILANL